MHLYDTPQVIKNEMMCLDFSVHFSKNCQD